MRRHSHRRVVSGVSPASTHGPHASFAGFKTGALIMKNPCLMANVPRRYVNLTSLCRASSADDRFGRSSNLQKSSLGPAACIGSGHKVLLSVVIAPSFLPWLPQVLYR